jgi:hypothetical protein
LKWRSAPKSRERSIAGDYFKPADLIKALEV